MLLPQRYDLSDLDRDITEEEVKQLVLQTPSEKASRSDGYIGAFYTI
jgi:hypothetical protein